MGTKTQFHGVPGVRMVAVGIGEMAVSDDPSEVLITYSLGSCIGVSMYDPAVKIGGLIHCMLPLSKVNRDKARQQPAMFVDTGIVELLREMYKLGATSGNVIAKVAGGAAVLDKKELFRIGKRNLTVLRKILWKNNILLEAEDVGGARPRTLHLEIKTGSTVVKSRGTGKRL